MITQELIWRVQLIRIVLLKTFYTYEKAFYISIIF